MDVILYLASPHATTCSQLKFLGTQQRLMEEGYSLRKVVAENLAPSDIKELVSFWKARGIIADCGGQRPPVSEQCIRRTPIVYLDMAREFESPRSLSVSYDIRATCHMAARELLSLDCASYGYVGYGEGITWSEERKRVFTRAMSLNGHAVETFDYAPHLSTPSVFYRKLTKWIRGRRTPLGIFAADDAYAIHLHAIVQKLNLRIPADVAILGVDDESDILTSPGISSIQLDFRKAGFLAAELLIETLTKPNAPHSNRYFGPVQLLRRSSTRKMHRSNDNMTSILKRIHVQAPRGLTALEVSSWMTGSRRLAELRFRSATGHSILEEITAARIARAKELLASVDNPIGEISELCGYRTINAFRDAFKAQTGATPSDWRKQL